MRSLDTFLYNTKELIAAMSKMLPQTATDHLGLADHVLYKRAILLKQSTPTLFAL